MGIKNPETSGNFENSFERPLVVSKFKREELIEKILEQYPEAKEILDQQELVSVKYLNKENQICEGQIFIDRNHAPEIKELFDFLITQKFIIEKVVPIQSELYNADDELSMQDNNSSALNFRFIEGTNRLSLHAFGFAIDINPRENPLQKDGLTLAPKGAERDLNNPQTLVEDHPVVKWLEERGWEWGGRWQEPYQDYHHFQKPLATSEYVAELRKQFQQGVLTEDEYTARLEKAHNNLDSIKNHEKV